MDLKRAIIENDVEAVEKILKKELADQPRDKGLWIKLCLTELQFPFEDHESALACINEINRFSDNDIDVLILEAGIKWHNMGFIDDGLFMRLSKVKTKNMSQMAIIFYLGSLYFHSKRDLKSEGSILRRSVEMYDKYVYPYKALGDIVRTNSKNEGSRSYYQKALANVQKIYQDDDLYDFTDIDTYIAEYITGTAISQANYESIKDLI